MSCLSSMVNLNAVAALLLHLVYNAASKEYLARYFYAVKISISLAILSEILIQNDYFF